jgi:predicted double-glycine peptidase
MKIFFIGFLIILSACSNSTFKEQLAKEAQKKNLKIVFRKQNFSSGCYYNVLYVSEDVVNQIGNNVFLSKPLLDQEQVILNDLANCHWI